VNEPVISLPRRKRSKVAATTRRRVVVLGNPNTGKTSLFNRIAGTNLRVGNYPGVTVEHTAADVQLGSVDATLVDLPGTYSLCGRSAEERIAIDALLGLGGHEAPDLVLLVADATHLQRSLYLAIQAAELRVPVLVALNMSDEALSEGIDINVSGLSEALGLPVVSCSARTGDGIEALQSRLAWVLEDPNRAVSEYRTALPTSYDTAIEAAAALVAEWLPGTSDEARARAQGIWALMSVEEAGDEEPTPADIATGIQALRADLAAADLDLDEAVADARYAWLDDALDDLVTRPPGSGRGMTDKIDAVLVHPVYGFATFVILMTLLFQGLFSWSDPAIGLVEAFFGLLGDGVSAAVPAGLVQEFLVNGVIAGVGAVVVFLPQILLLFLLIGLMEDSGYMARVAYLMDRIMKSVGLHGRAFVPMLSGFACAVPAILATRTMERRRDRFLTMMVVPLTTCSARLPVYTLLIAALFPATVKGLPVQGLTLAFMYLLSLVTALLAAAIMGRTILKGRNEPLLLELPPYRRPAARTVFRMMWDRSKVFLTEAGTVILVCTIILWGLLSFPRVDPVTLAPNVSVASATLEGSYAADLGHALEPLIEPLGFDWKIGVGLVGSFAAREVFVATMGVVYGLEDDVDEESATLREKIRAEQWPDGRPVYSPLVGLSLMVFFAFAAQCMSTLAAIRRETQSWRWPVFVVVYMTALAWFASFVVYQGGRALGLG
jgi:ferrous iron transport protein B